MNYESMNDDQKQSTIKKLYEVDKKSFGDIAKELGTYANKIRRDAIKYKINIRDKSDAQKNALKTGKHKHPTKGQIRNEATKMKIGGSVMKSWNTMTDSELKIRKQTAKEQWDKRSDDEKKHMQQMANTAVRISSKEGSKLEKFILDKLIRNGYKVKFHEEQILSNTKLQIDLFIPSMSIAIEIDGPSHFLPVWGDDVLSRNKKYDEKKEGLIIGKGLTLIRIKQTKDFSKSRASLIYDKLIKILTNIDTQTKQYSIEDN